MARGKKTGGRSAGTPNKKTQEVLELLESLSCNPIEGMVRIAQDGRHSPELRGKMYAHLAEYAYPKRRAVEVASESNGQIHVSWGGVQEPDIPTALPSGSEGSEAKWSAD